MPRHLLVANPTAQSGRNAARIARARRVLDALGLAHDFLPTEPGGGTAGAVRRALDADGYKTAISMGGDGTFAEVARGILASRRKRGVRLAMLPTGTSNDQGKSFGLSSDEGSLERNARVIAAGRELRLDVGRLQAVGEDGKPARAELFFDSAGWGLGALVLARRNRDREAIAKTPVLRELWRDHLVYAGALARSLLDPALGGRKFDARVAADGSEVRWRGLLDLVVKATAVYAGSWVLDRDGRPDDGRFEVVPFMGRRDLLSKAVVAHGGLASAAETLAGLGLRPSKGLSARRIAIEFSSPVPAQVDGEEAPAARRAEIEVLERELRLVVPEEHAARAGR